MRVAIIEDNSGLVINTIEWEENSSFVVPDGFSILQREDAVIGNHWNGSTFTEVSTPVVDASNITITARQFFIALANSSFVTAEEAVSAAVNGTIPASINAVIETLPSEQALAVKITWAKMTTISRSDPLIAAFGAALSLTSEMIDQFFIVARNI